MRGPATAEPDAVHPGWPEATGTVVMPSGDEVRLRPLVARDGQAWASTRVADKAWLKPVEPTQPGTWIEAHDDAAWRRNFRNLRDHAQNGRVVPLVIEVNGDFAGQVTIGNIQHGSISEAWIGYWVYSAHMGKGIATAACGLGTDHAFQRIGLHRLTATYLPDNPASGRVLAHNGYREEGYLTGNLHIDGRWRDHHFVAQLVDEYPTTCIERLMVAGRVTAWR